MHGTWRGSGSPNAACTSLGRCMGCLFFLKMHKFGVKWKIFLQTDTEGWKQWNEDMMSTFCELWVSRWEFEPERVVQVWLFWCEKAAKNTSVKLCASTREKMKKWTPTNVNGVSSRVVGGKFCSFTCGGEVSPGLSVAVGRGLNLKSVLKNVWGVGVLLRREF